jgi:hypothetical protein
MAEIVIDPPRLRVRFTRAEHVAGLIRDVDVPLSSVRSVEVAADGEKGTRGMRAPGLAVPFRRKVGTWRGKGRRSAVSVRGGEPALRVGLEGERFTELLIGTPDAEQVADRLRSLAAR